MAVERARRDQLGRAALAAVGRLDVVEHRAARAPEVDAGRLVGRVRLGADVEAEHHARLLGGRPHRVPQVVVVRRHVEGLPGRHEDDLEAEVGDAVDLGDGVVDVEQRQRRRAHEPRRLALELDRPVVEHLDALAHEPRVADRERPRGQRGIDHLTPDALLVEVDQPQLRFVGARRAREHLDEADGLRVLRLPAQLLELLGGPVLLEARHPPAERLTVDVDGLVAAVLVLHAAGHALGEIGGEVLLEQVARFAQVGIPGVGPDLAVHARALLRRARAPCGVPGRGRRHHNRKLRFQVGGGADNGLTFRHLG